MTEDFRQARAGGSGSARDAATSAGTIAREAGPPRCLPFIPGRPGRLMARVGVDDTVVADPALHDFVRAECSQDAYITLWVPRVVTHD